MDQASSLLSFIATYASGWTYAYIQDGYAKARLGGAVLPNVSPDAASMLEALERSANLWPQGRLLYAKTLAGSAKLDKNISLKYASSKEIRNAALAVGSKAGNLSENQLNSLLGYVEEARTPTSNLARQGFSFEGDAGVIVSDNGKSSTSPGGFWDGVDFNSVSDLLLGLGGIATTIINGNGQLPHSNIQNPGPAQSASSSSFISIALIAVGIVAVSLLGIILYKSLK